MILHAVIIIGFVLVVVDLAMTFRGRPLFKPGPIAKSMYPELTDDDEHGIL